MNGCPETNSAQFTPDSGVGLKLPKMFRWKFGLVLAGFVGMSAIRYTAGYASDVETALNELASDSVAQYPCVRLMTAANGDIGCSTGKSGVSGALYPITSLADVNGMAALDSYPKRAVVMDASVVTKTILDALKADTSRVAGVVLLQASVPSAFSPASTTLPGSAYPWNPDGMDILNQRYPFPVIVVTDPVQINDIKMKVDGNRKKGAKGYPLHALHFFFYFGPQGLTSTQCLRDESCLAVGGQSVWASFGDPRLDVAKPLVLATATMDSNAMFHDLAFGAESAVSGTVALLAAAHALSKTDVAALPNRVAFAGFRGESFGRVGSRRFANELKSFSCDAGASVNATNSASGFAFCQSPLRTDLAFTNLTTAGLAHVIAVDQVGCAKENKGYVHPASSSSLLRDVMIGAAAGVTGAPIIQAGSVVDVPVTPVTSFLESFPGTSAGVLSDYDTAFATPYYHSHLDRMSTLSAANVTVFASVLARSLYALATGNTNAASAVAAVPSTLQADGGLVQSLLQCFAGNSSCTLFSNYTGTLGNPSAPISMYTSVYNPPFTVGSNGFGVPQAPVETFVLEFLAAVTLTPHGFPGEGLPCTSTADCDKLNIALDCILSTGKCGVRTAFVHDAFSPALTKSSTARGGFTFNMTLVSAVDPLWTEPYWSSSIGVSTLLIGDPRIDAAMFGGGIGVIVLSALATYWMRGYIRSTFKVD